MQVSTRQPAHQMAARFSKAFRAREDATNSIARVYADINDQRPPDYWDYEALQVQVRNPPGEGGGGGRCQPAAPGTAPTGAGAGVRGGHVPVRPAGWALGPAPAAPGRRGGWVGWACLAPRTTPSSTLRLPPPCPLQWGEQDNYEVVRKVGRGKYSEVFEASVWVPCRGGGGAACMPCLLGPPAPAEAPRRAA